ncbi:sulfatase family protein [Aquisalinus flavus]|uniref:Sulfatase N-terminal domain-containing protein n=1 Tax=Aquisalinus flavus TaxID=1526572 RepID=A0A8J2Y3Z0_9PROT|nr:sulfatase [Aquisalinus flavus]MBD0425962.1 sulfatase [Aquisalinus flavus]UNE48445.1 sulfatase [Aquisalinus flavus]GGD11846.1 hypothetical protein GCM10011342_20810 [Aquisalinus flavus]
MSAFGKLLCVLVCVAVAGCAPDVEQESPSDRPNIVLIIADDISQDFGAYGVDISTPHFDQLARDGVLFDNAYVAASSCSPSRNSLITGRYPHNHGAPELHMPLPEGQFAFPQALKEAGYYTLAAGKWHMGPAPKSAFDKVNDILYTDDYTGADTWISELQQRPGDKPFFFWLASFDAHRPWEADSTVTPHDPSSVTLPAGVPDTPASREDYASYLDEVRRYDRLVGEVVAELKAQDVFDNTLVIVTSDNGRPFPRSKTTLYDAGMRTPLVAHWPDGGLQGGQVSDALVSLIDIAPTFLEVAGLPVPETVQGVSMLPVLKDPEAETRQVVFGERNWHVQRGVGRMVRKGDFVYIRDFTPGEYSFQMVDHDTGTYAELLRLRESGELTTVELEAFSTNRPEELLFDVSTDPQQTNNLVSSPEHGEILQDLRQLLNEWRDRTGDTIPPVEQQTVNRHDPDTFEQLYPGGRPPNGTIPGEQAGATRINDPGPR